MALSKAAIEALEAAGEELGLAWQANTRKTRGTDEVLYIAIGDGVAPTKIDGWIHACTLTARAMTEYAADPDAGVDVVGVLSWIGGNSALRYARWQADFHWKIDTRPWQFFLYMYPTRWAFRDTINGFTSLSSEDRAALHEVAESFWEEVVVAYTYRSEVIERSRGFAPHPDPTCGSSWQGYPYRKTWDREDVDYEDLALPFIEKGKSEYDRVKGKVEPIPYPAMENQIEPGLPTVAWEWVGICKSRGISDDFLRVRLGTRMVPTRFNGWWASLEEVYRFLEPFAKGSSASIESAEADSLGHDLTDYAVRFALCHSELQRRLNGEAQQLVDLLHSASGALKAILADRGLDAGAVDPFVVRAAAVIVDAMGRSLVVSDEELPELNIARPLHPRYAPVDPLEPLPWEVNNPQRYLEKMARLGYTL